VRRAATVLHCVVVRSEPMVASRRQTRRLSAAACERIWLTRFCSLTSWVFCSWFRLPLFWLMIAANRASDSFTLARSAALISA